MGRGETDGAADRSLGAWQVKRSEMQGVAVDSTVELVLAAGGIELRGPGAAFHARYRDCEFYNSGRREGRLFSRGQSVWLRSLDGANAGQVQDTILALRGDDRRVGPGSGANAYPRQLTLTDGGEAFFWGSVLASSQLPGIREGQPCFMWFRQDGVVVGSTSMPSPEDETVVPYSEVTSLNIGGRGVLTQASGGGFIGGGFGVTGAVEGMLVASALNSLTSRTRTTVETIVELASGSRALLLLNGDEAPDLLRTHLAPAFTRIEEAHRRAAGGASVGAGAAPDRLAQLKALGELRDAGVLTPDEFEVEKARVLHS
jgi:hypothetical protein